MKTSFIFIILIFITLKAGAVKVKFIVANTSVNVAEGSTGVFTSFKLYPNNYVDADTNNLRGLVDFEKISYGDIV